MQIKALTGAAVLLALAPSALAVGSAIVVNNCDFPVYYASVGPGYGSAMKAIEPNGKYTETYSQPNSGISIKLAPVAVLEGQISQFEFTWAAGKIFYDLSNINGYPFAVDGMELVPSMADNSANSACVPVNCPAGQAICTAAYNAPDDIRTMVCDEQSDLVLTMCPSSTKEKRSEPAFNGLTRYRVHSRYFPTV